jgi:hypothetical protein
MQRIAAAFVGRRRSGELLLLLSAVAPVRDVTQLASNHRRKPCQVPFDQVVVRAGRHHLATPVFVERVQDHDEWHLQPTDSEDFKGVLGSESMQSVGAQDDVPGGASSAMDNPDAVSTVALRACSQRA